MTVEPWPVAVMHSRGDGANSNKTMFSFLPLPREVSIDFLPSFTRMIESFRIFSVVCCPHLLVHLLLIINQLFSLIGRLREIKLYGPGPKYDGPIAKYNTYSLRVTRRLSFGPVTATQDSISSELWVRRNFQSFLKLDYSFPHCPFFVELDRFFNNRVLVSFQVCRLCSLIQFFTTWYFATLLLLCILIRFW